MADRLEEDLVIDAPVLVDQGTRVPSALGVALRSLVGISVGLFMSLAQPFLGAEQLKSPEVECPFANMRPPDWVLRSTPIPPLCNANLSGADLSKARLTDANLSGADLSGANLSEAQLSGAELSGARFLGANLTRANLSGTDFSAADLRRAKLSGAILAGADFSGANLDEADLSTVGASSLSVLRQSKLWVGKPDFSGASLEEADVSDADLSGSSFAKAKLRRANLAGADLSEVDFSDADLLGAKLNQTTLRHANLSGAVLEGIDAQTLQSVIGLEFAKNLSEVRFVASPSVLAALREIFAKRGLREQEREITFAKMRTQRELGLGVDQPLWRKAESVFNYLAFELPCGYGLYYGRPLRVLGVSIFLFTLVYMAALRSQGSAALWRIWPSGQMRKQEGDVDRERLSWNVNRWPGGPQRTFVVQSCRACGLGLFFSLLSAFQIGWREFNVRNWITRLQPRDYDVSATGWIRVVSGIQSLLSVYLLALWALTYFGRPFE